MKKLDNSRLSELILKHSGEWLLCASNGTVLESSTKNLDEGSCHKTLFDDKDPCSDCPVISGNEEIQLSPRIGYNQKNNILFVERIIPLTEDKKGEFLIQYQKISQSPALDKRIAQLKNLSTIGQLSTGVAHDFNNILTSVLGQAGTLKKLLKDPKLKEIVVNIEKAARSGAATVFRIKNFATSLGSEDHKPVDLNRLIEEVVAFSKPKWLERTDLGSGAINLKLDLQGSIIVWGNEHELRNALVNLVFNSVEAMENGGTLKIRTSSKSGFGKVSIEDSGSGMDQKTLKNLFTPFFTTKESTGTGLGLTECKNIIEGHKGTLKVESALGHGTTVHVRMPLSKTGLSDSKPLSSEVAGTFNILVFDDQEYVLEVTRELLEELGHTVSAWMNVREGLEYFKTNDIDLVITDYGMKEMNGLEVAQEVKKFNHEMPVILMSGWVVDIDSDPAMKNAIDLSLPKPFSIEEMNEAVGRVMNSEKEA